MQLHGFQTVLGTGRFETAAAARTAYKMQKRSQRPTINLDKENHDRFHLGAWQNRKPTRQKQPFLAQFGVGRSGGSRFGHRHDQPARFNPGTFQPANFAQAAPDAIANHRLTHPFRGNETKPAADATGLRNHAQTQKPPLYRAAFLANESEVPAKPDARRVRKPEPIRLRCDGRNGVRHPSARGACDRVADGGSEWPVRFWSSSARGSRTAVCACACWVDRCVS